MKSLESGRLSVTNETKFESRIGRGNRGLVAAKGAFLTSGEGQERRGIVGIRIPEIYSRALKELTHSITDGSRREVPVTFVVEQAEATIESVEIPAGKKPDQWQNIFD